MKSIVLKNPLFVVAISRFIGQAIQLEQLVSVMEALAPEGKKELIKELIQSLETLIPLIERLKEGEIPPEVEQMVKDAKAKGETLAFTLKAEEPAASAASAKTPAVLSKEEEDAIDDLLNSIPND